MFTAVATTVVSPDVVHHLIKRALGGIRTPNLLIRSQVLYPLGYERISIDWTDGYLTPHPL